MRASAVPSRAACALAHQPKSLATLHPQIRYPAMTIAWRNVQFEVQITHPARTSSPTACYNTLALVLFRMNPAHFFARRGVSGQPDTPPGYAPASTVTRVVMAPSSPPRACNCTRAEGSLGTSNAFSREPREDEVIVMASSSQSSSSRSWSTDRHTFSSELEEEGNLLPVPIPLGR